MDGFDIRFVKQKHKENNSLGGHYRLRAGGNFKADSSDWVYVDLSAGGTGKAGYSAFDPAARYMRVGN